MTAADLALVGAAVRTLDPDRPDATALAVRDGRIVAVGSETDVRGACDHRTEVIDLDGAAVVPGLIDAHTHPFMGALEARGVDLMDARTLDDVRRLVRAERERRADGEWVLGYGLDYNAFEATGIHGELLADAAGGGPALLTFVDVHTSLATPRALELAGVDGPRNFGEHAEIVCDDAGRPTGELRESAAMELLRAAVPPLSDEGRYALFAATLRRFAAAGITSTHAMNGDLSTLELLARLEARGDLATRIVAPFLVAPESTEDEWAAFAARRDAAGRRWRGGVAKFFIDGVIDSGTAWLFAPDSEGAGTSPFWPDPAQYRRAVAYFAGRGFQCVTHACGDRGVHEALNAYRDAGAPQGAPHRVEHIETIQPDDLPRFAAEGVTASMQTQHMMELAHDRTDNWSARLGPDRCDRAFLTRDLWESGALVALGSDWPVARYDPREGLASARLRRNPSRPEQVPYDDQALDGLRALEGYTRNAARAVGEEERLGVLRPGCLADVTVLDRDPVDTAAEELMDARVRLTVVDGEVVHRDL
ncbi:amidohydrolase [Patulibacter sp. S7RM1-6]